MSVLGNGVIHLVNHVAADMAVFVRGLPLVCGVGDGKRPGIFKGFVQRQGYSGLFLPWSLMVSSIRCRSIGVFFILFSILLVAANVHDNS